MPVFLLLSPSMLLFAAAVIPALFLLGYVYRQDRVEKESPQLLLSLVLQGVIATTIAKILERVGLFAVGHIVREGTVPYSALLYLGVVGFAEEGAKYFLLKRRTWNHPEFNYRFDAVVYAVFVSLGFALWENLGYVFSYGLGTAMIRAVTAIPGHACFGVYMGCWYGQAYERFRRGDEPGSRSRRVTAVVLPALLHGAYDFLADMTERLSGWYFVLFVAALFFVTFRAVRRLAGEDRYIP